MKTIFMQQIIALAIVTTSITSIFGTPLPQTQAASLLRVREVPSPRSFDSASLRRYGEQLEEVTSTSAEFNASVPAPHPFLISPRASPEEINSIISDTKSKLRKLAEATPHPSKDANSLENYLKAVTKAYATLLELDKSKGSEAGLRQLRHVVLENINTSLDDLPFILDEITEEGGTPLIRHSIEIAEMSLRDPLMVRDNAQLMLAAIDCIIGTKLQWTIFTDKNVGLKKVRMDLKHKFGA